MQVLNQLQVILTCCKKKKNARLKYLRNNKENIVNIINLLIKILTLKKEISKNYL